MASKRTRTEGAPRPWRLWDPRAKADIRWRYYSHPYYAKRAAILLAHESPVGFIAELYSTENGQHIGTCIRRVSGITFERAMNHVRDKPARD